MATEDNQVAAQTLRSLTRHLDCLSKDEKSTRKRALESIKKETIDKGLPGAVLEEVFACLLKSLLKCLADPVERCRELSVQIISGFIRGVSKPETSLQYLMPALTQRLGRAEIVEPAEELRLYLVEVLSVTVEVCGRHLALYIDNIINILQRTIADPFPDVKRESCKCTIHLAQCVPDLFQSQAECLLKPLKQNVIHRHSRVRVAALEAIGAVIQYGAVKNMDDLLSHLAQRLFDDSHQVRKSLTLVVGNCLLNFRDRYSYFPKLIPLLLSSACDDLPEIKALAWELWRQVGLQWEKENEDDLQDKMDSHPSPSLYYPSGVERPGLGCRELVVRNLSKLVSSVNREVSDWLVQTRVKLMKLLWVLLLHAEDHCMQHLKPLLITLYHACGDLDQDVKRNALESARLLGVFVNPEVLLKTLLSHVENSSSYSLSSPWAPLMVLAVVLKCSKREVLQQHLLHVGNTLAHPEVCQHSQKVIYLEQLLECVEALLEVCKEDCGILSLPLLKVLVTVQSLSTENKINRKVEECLIRLCEVLSLNNVYDLYKRHMVHLLQWLSESQQSWSIYSTQKTQLEIITFQSGPVICEFLPELLQILQNWLEPNQDPELRLQIFTMLSKLLVNFSNMLNSEGKFSEHLYVFLQKVLLPNMVWHAGRTAAAVRISALSCLLAMLEGEIVSREQVLNVESVVSAYLISALEEDSHLSRLLACRAIHSLIKLSEQCLNPETLNKIYPELLKGIGDSNDEVRVEALKALMAWFSSLGNNYDRNIHHPHIRFLFQQLLLYLDDPDQQIQLKTLEVLKSSSAVDHVVLQQEVEAVRNKQRSTENCDQILQYIQSLGNLDVI